MGYQVSENCQVPSCAPGMVYIRGEALPPHPGKWSSVQLEDGQVQICWSLIKKDKIGALDRGKRWSDMHREDLHRLECTRPGSKGRFTHALTGIACSGARPLVSASCAYNQAKALLGRMFRQPAERAWGRGPKPGTWEWAKKFIPIILPHFESPGRMSDEEWLRSMPARRQRPLRRGMDNYRSAGYQAKFEKFKCFVKTELLPGFGKDQISLTRLDAMLDRNICGPAEEAHCMVGPEVKPLIGVLKETWNPDNFLFYGSATPEKLHYWLQRLIFGSGTFFWADYSMYDNTHSEESWDFMEHLYRESGITNSDTWRMLSAWRAPKGTIGPMKFRGNVMNASGRDDTALANAVLNGFAMYLSVCAAYYEKPLPELTVDDAERFRPQCILSVCGDDSLGRLPFLPVERRADFFQAVGLNISMFGFEAKLNYSDKLYDAVYLGMRPYPTSKGWFWGKTIGRATYKMGWSLMEKGRDLTAHMTGIADMHTLCSSHVPVLADMARRIVELRRGCKRTPVQFDPNRPWEWTLGGGEYDETTLKAVADMYSQVPTGGCPSPHSVVTVADVQDLIKEIRSVPRLPFIVDHWLWRRMIHSDDL